MKTTTLAAAVALLSLLASGAARAEAPGDRTEKAERPQSAVVGQAIEPSALTALTVGSAPWVWARDLSSL